MVFGVSHSQAMRLLSKLDNKKQSSSNYVTLDVTYEQLGRYTAFRRQPENLIDYWKSPIILVNEWECNTPEEDTPIDVRKPKI